MKKNAIPMVLLTIIISFGIAFFAFFLLISHIVSVEPELVRENNILNFYDQNHDGDIFILGNSLVDEGIDAYIVEKELQKENINRSVYVLGMSGESPLDRICEMDNIIRSNPKLVVIGLSYVSLGNSSTIQEDRMLTCTQRKSSENRDKFKDLFLSFVSEDQLKHISQTPFERILYQRKFIPPYVFSSSQRLDGCSFINRDRTPGQDTRIRMPYAYIANFKDPWINTDNKTQIEKINLLGNLKNSYVVSKDVNPQKRALSFMIDTFQKNNISVVIINMPLDPYYSGIINESTRQNLSDFLNSTGAPWYNYEQEYPQEYFRDTQHMNVAGRTVFSSNMAKILADHLIHGA